MQCIVLASCSCSLTLVPLVLTLRPCLQAEEAAAAPADEAADDDDETPLGQLSAPSPAMPGEEALREAALVILNSVDVSGGLLYRRMRAGRHAVWGTCMQDECVRPWEAGMGCQVLLLKMA